jgi:hypothetical protein
MIHAGGIMAKEAACRRRIVPGSSSGSPPREGWLLRGPSSRAYSVNGSTHEPRAFGRRSASSRSGYKQGSVGL